MSAPLLQTPGVPRGDPQASEAGEICQARGCRLVHPGRARICLETTGHRVRRPLPPRGRRHFPGSRGSFPQHGKL